MKEHEGAEITEDDLLEEPDVSIEEETKENTVTVSYWLHNKCQPGLKPKLN